MQLQLRPLARQPVQPRDDPARQHAARTAQHQRRLLRPAAQLRPGCTQWVEGRRRRAVQAVAEWRQCHPAALADEQRGAQGVFQRPQLPADRAVGDVQLGRGAADALQPGHSLECAQSVQRRQILGHDV